MGGGGADMINFFVWMQDSRASILWDTLDNVENILMTYIYSHIYKEICTKRNVSHPKLTHKNGINTFTNVQKVQAAKSEHIKNALKNIGLVQSWRGGGVQKAKKKERIGPRS